MTKSKRVVEKSRCAMLACISIKAGRRRDDQSLLGCSDEPSIYPYTLPMDRTTPVDRPLNFAYK